MALNYWPETIVIEEWKHLNVFSPDQRLIQSERRLRMFVRRWWLSLKCITESDYLILQVPELVCLYTRCQVQLRAENQQAQSSVQDVKIFKCEGEQILEQELRKLQNFCPWR